MWFGRFEDAFGKLFALACALIVFKECEAIKSSDFNAQLRDYSESENNLNLSEAKTLQQQGLGHYAGLPSAQDPTKFKDNYDSTISGSSHARGLHHEYAGYGYDYEDPGFGHGYENPLHGNHYQPYDYHHYPPAGHHGYGHYKYYDHGLGHKALLWPIAGIALLGAAAALVTNPVLLQLGVVSGKRRRRHIEDIEDVAKNSIKKWSQIAHDQKDGTNNIAKKVIKKKMLSKDDFKVDKQVSQSVNRDKLQFETINNDYKRYSKEDQRYIPIPLKIKKP